MSNPTRTTETVTVRVDVESFYVNDDDRMQTTGFEETMPNLDYRRQSAASRATAYAQGVLWMLVQLGDDKATAEIVITPSNGPERVIQITV